MNPTEQHDRRSSIARLDERIDTLAAAVDDEVRDRMQELRELIARLIATEHHERVAASQVDGRITERHDLAIIALNFYTSQFLAMTLRERMRWFVLGRLPRHISEFTTDPEATIFGNSEPAIAQQVLGKVEAPDLDSSV
jgi:hypothetical protein